METKKKEKIIYWLHEFGRLPTSRFTGLLGVNHDTIKKLLNELEEEKRIKRIEETLATYWEINNEKGDENEKEI